MVSNYVRVKICGICDLDTAMAATNAGADALGFVFAPSRRRISPDQAKKIIGRLPPFISKVGVFVNAAVEEVTGIAGYAGLDTIQLHGDEPPDFCRRLEGYQVIKSFPVADRPDTGLIKKYNVAAYLLDTMVPGARGGTGKRFNWGAAAGLDIGPLILAGGLTPDNVREAVRTVRPYAVDVSSGVETLGLKDYRKIADFIRRAKGE